MTGEQILIALGSMDDTLLELCENYRTPRRTTWKTLAAAACFALALLAGGAAALYHARIPVRPEPGVSQTQAGETAAVTQTQAEDETDVSVVFPPDSQIAPPSESAEKPPETAATTAAWNSGAGRYEGQIDGRSGGDAADPDEASAQETDALFRKAPITTKYPSLVWQGRTYTSRGNSDPSDKVQKTVLGTAELTGFDGKHRTKAQVCSVGGVSQAAAVAVQFPDSDRYYTYICASFAPATLGAYLDAFSFWDNAAFTRVSGCSRKYQATIYPAPQIQTLQRLFDRDAPLADVGEYDCPQDMTIDCTIPILGVRGSVFGVSETGYLQCRLTDSTVIYYVGPERAKAFLDTVDAGEATHLVPTTGALTPAEETTHRPQDEA